MVCWPLSSVVVLLLVACCCSCAPPPTDVAPELLYSGPGITPPEAEPEGLSIDLQESFENDRVRVYVDDRLVYSGTLTTPDDGTGLTDSVQCKATGDLCHLRILVGGREWRSTVELRNGRYLGIGYHDGGVRIVQTKAPMLYD